MIKVPCPGCTSTLNAPDHLTGQKIACPKCRQWLRVPILPPPNNVDTTSQPASKRVGRMFHSLMSFSSGWGWAAGGAALVLGVLGVVIILGRGGKPAEEAWYKWEEARQEEKEPVRKTDGDAREKYLGAKDADPKTEGGEALGQIS